MVDHPESSQGLGETEMIDKSQRQLDDGTDKDPIEELRELCLATGFSGIVSLGRTFRRMDDDGNKQLSLEKFIKGLQDTELDISDEKATEIFKRWINWNFRVFHSISNYSLGLCF